MALPDVYISKISLPSMLFDLHINPVKIPDILCISLRLDRDIIITDRCRKFQAVANISVKLQV